MQDNVLENDPVNVPQIDQENSFENDPENDVEKFLRKISREHSRERVYAIPCSYFNPNLMMTHRLYLDNFPSGFPCFKLIDSCVLTALFACCVYILKQLYSFICELHVGTLTTTYVCSIIDVYIFVQDLTCWIGHPHQKDQWYKVSPIPRII